MNAMAVGMQGATPRRAEPHRDGVSREQLAQFEQWLTGKAGVPAPTTAHDQPDPDGSADRSTRADSVPMLVGAMAAAASPVPSTNDARGIACETAPSATAQQQQAVAALSAAADLPGHTPGAHDTGGAAQAWQLSIHEPLGVSLAVQAHREAATPGAVTPAAWTLAIASPQLDAPRFARHAPRLAARLRQRAARDFQLDFTDDTDDTEAST